MALFREKFKLHSFCLLFVLGAACLATAPKLWAQTRTTRPRPARPIATQPTTAAPAEEQPRYKAIWEPKNYPDDVILLDVFFVNDQVGWVSGGSSWKKGGFILQTRDGGDHWAVQLGDPQSSDPSIKDIRFIDETHGWARQGDKLIRTTDGANWEDAGSLPPFSQIHEYAFTSPNRGIAVGGYATEGAKIFTTRDGGKTWKQVFTCATRLEVNGLTQNAGCYLNTFHFPSPRVGYAVGGSFNDGPGQGFFVVAKTEDGGETWSVVYTFQTIPHADAVFFTNASTGVTRNHDGKFYFTNDGGLSWKGVTGSGDWEQHKIAFADPEVGWSGGERKLGFSTDGGTHWNSRDLRFPASVQAFSLPSRRRAYVVGEHGMIYRYRVVPLDYNVAGMLDAPLMPGSDLRIQPDIQRLKNRIQALRARLEQGAQGGTSGTGQNTQSENAASAESETATQGGDSSTGGGFTQDTLVSEGFTQSASESSGSTQSAGVSGGTQVAGDAVTGSTASVAAAGGTQGTGDVGNGPAQDTGSSGFTQQTGEAAPASNFVQSCCAAQVQGVQASMGLVTQDVSAVSTKFRSLNMILSGMRLFSQLVGKTQAMRSSFVALKGAKDAQSALAALSQFSASLEDMTRTAATGFQSQGGGSAQAQPAFQQ